MRLVLAAVIILSPMMALGQHMVLSGKVIDDKTREPLSFVSIFMKSGSSGTMSNPDGEFSLGVAPEHRSDTVLITMMGYFSFEIRLSEVPKSQPLIVPLKSRSIELTEVVITGERPSANEIAVKAFKKLKENFLTTPYVVRGFYRETHAENNVTVLLTEVALDVYDLGYSTEASEKVDVKSIRTSTDYRNECFKKTVIERFNLVASALRCNPVKHPHSDIIGNIKRKKCTIDSVVYLNDRPVYVISYFTHISRYPLFERRNILFVDAENYAIHKYGWEEYATKGKYSEKAWQFNQNFQYLTSRKRISTIYEFGNFQGKMYLKYFDEKCYDDILNAIDQSVVFEAMGRVTWINTEIDLGAFTPNFVETLRRDQSLTAQAKPYDPAFWSNYREVALVPLTRKEIKDLERDKPLEEQFRESGKRNLK